MNIDILKTGTAIFASLVAILFFLSFINFLIEAFFFKKKYRIVEIKDSLINGNKPFWKIEKRRIFFGKTYWSEYFEEHSEDSATYYNKDEALKWFEYHVNPKSRTVETLIKES